MIIFKHGDLLAEDTEAFVNPVNCAGVMGAGLALQFKNAYPENFVKYKKACAEGKVQLGKMFVTVAIESRTKHIINFPTKKHWKDKSNIDDIKEGLRDLVNYVQGQKFITSISIPALGCGNGGLQWSDVKPLIVSAFESIPQVHAIVFEPKMIIFKQEKGRSIN